MRKLKLFILILSLGLISSTSFSEDGEEEAVQPSNPQELLEIVKKNKSIYLEEYAKEMIKNEEIHSLTVEKMLKDYE